MTDLIRNSASYPSLYRDLYGIHDSLEFDLLQESTVRQYYSHLAEKTIETGLPLQDLASSIIHSKSDGIPLYNFQGRVNVGVESDDVFSTILPAEYLSDIMSDDDRRKFQDLLDELESIPSSPDPLLFESYEKSLLDSVKPLAFDDADLLTFQVEKPNHLKGGDDLSRVTWISNLRFTSNGPETYSTKNVDPKGPWNKRLKWNERADVARDYYGLHHYYSKFLQNSLLAALFIPSTSIPKDMRLFRPTALDGDGERFKVIYGDFYTAMSESGDGRTLDLTKIGDERPHRGGSEIVVSNFQPVGPISFTILGFLRGKENPANSFENYFKSLRHTDRECRDPAELAEKLSARIK